MKTLIIVLSGMILASCCNQPIGSQARLPLPQDLIYPKISAEELRCLSDSAYKKLNERRVMCEGRVKTLKNTILKARP